MRHTRRSAVRAIFFGAQRGRARYEGFWQRGREPIRRLRPSQCGEGRGRRGLCGRQSGAGAPGLEAAHPPRLQPSPPDLRAAGHRRSVQKPAARHSFARRDNPGPHRLASADHRRAHSHHADGSGRCGGHPRQALGPRLADVHSLVSPHAEQCRRTPSGAGCRLYYPLWGPMLWAGQIREG